MRRSVTNEKSGGFHRLQVGSIFFLILRFAQISFGLLPGNGFTPLSKFHRIEKRGLLVCKAAQSICRLSDNMRVPAIFDDFNQTRYLPIVDAFGFRRGDQIKYGFCSGNCRYSN